MHKYSGIVLAGGLGTRLRSAFHSGPKSMAPIAGTPFLEYMLSKMQVSGITDVVLCVGYKRSYIQEHFSKGAKWGMQVRYSVEKQLLGTGGAIKKAADMMSADNVFVFNGDSFLDLDVQAMWEFHHRHNAIASVALTEVPDASRYGSVLVNERKEIIAFREKQENVNACERGIRLVNAGAYLLNRRILDGICSERAVSIEKEVFPKLTGADLYGYLTKGYFIDIGTPEDFARAQQDLPTRWKV